MKIGIRVSAVLVVAGMIGLASSEPAAAAATESVLYSFCSQANCTDGSEPYAGLVMDAAGNQLYGTTLYGGNVDCGSGFGCGTVFELSETSSGWQETVLHSFNGTDGAYPYAGLIMDAAGNLYGTTSGSASDYYTLCFSDENCGTVFELSKTSSGWQETVLYTFKGTDGLGPFGGLVMDTAGNLYGTTVNGGQYGGGTVFELSKTSSGWQETVLHSFNLYDYGADGAFPYAGLIMDTAGNLYGTTYQGGQHGGGTAFRLSKTSSGWQETVMYNFCSQGAYCSDGSQPYAGLVIDKSGNLYGTTLGGGEYHYGTVFELSETSSGWQETVMYNFANGTDGGSPYAGLVINKLGNLYGTTSSYDQGDGGAAFRLSKTSSGWQEVVMFSFANSTDGGNPYAALTLLPRAPDELGKLYGTTRLGGAYGTCCRGGTVFELTR